MSEALDNRLRMLVEWTTRTLGGSAMTCEPASGDASFRRYFRFTADDGSWIAMDAPPDREPLTPFLEVAARLDSIGLNAPKVIACDSARGFVLLTDLGQTQYLDALTAGTDTERLYHDAIDALIRLQNRGRKFAQQLPLYDEDLLRRELDLFADWYVNGRLGLAMTGSLLKMWRELQTLLVQSALAETRVAVHRDYHSRNLMVTKANNPGILDFQDAVYGPLSYDLVSLLEDCYIDLPEALERRLIETYLQRARAAGVVGLPDGQRFLRDYDLMGIQRHLKAAGIFSRLNERDGKPGYLKDIPRTLAYVLRAARRREQCQEFADFLCEHVPESTRVILR